MKFLSSYCLGSVRLDCCIGKMRSGVGFQYQPAANGTAAAESSSSSSVTPTPHQSASSTAASRGTGSVNTSVSGMGVRHVFIDVYLQHNVSRGGLRVCHFSVQ